MKLKIYVAAHQQTTAKQAAEYLTGLGHTVTSTLTPPDAERIQIAFDDVRAVQRSDVLVLLEPHNPITKIPGGKYVEVGVALGLGKRVFVIGPRMNMLLWHPLCVQLDSIEDLEIYV